ncbi:MAG: DegV family protein [Firmicutes bacterium]|nr:DegV family protein [Bacillota bacterium]
MSSTTTGSTLPRRTSTAGWRPRNCSPEPRSLRPAPGSAFEAAASAGADHILCFTISSRFTGTYASAVQSARIFREDAPAGSGRPRVDVVDTRLAAIAEGWVVIEAARAARRGAPVLEVLARAREVSARTRLVAVVDSLEYLMRGGHVPKLAGLAATALGVKPMAQLRHGDAVAAGVVRGIEAAYRSMLRRMARECRRVGQRTGRRARLHVGVMHAGAPERARELAELARERLRPVELLITDFTPVMGVHTGPGVCGVGYFAE